MAPAKLPTKNVKSCRQVLTSTDLMEKMEEAEKLKADKAKEKKEREMKRLEKAKQKSIKGNKITINDCIAILVSIYICIVITGKKEKTITTKMLSKKQPSMFICTHVSISSIHISYLVL